MYICVWLNSLTSCLIGFMEHMVEIVTIEYLYSFSFSTSFTEVSIITVCTLRLNNTVTQPGQHVTSPDIAECFVKSAWHETQGHSDLRFAQHKEHWSHQPFIEVAHGCRSPVATCLNYSQKCKRWKVHGDGQGTYKPT